MMVGVPSPPAPCLRRTGSGRRILTSTKTPNSTAPTTFASSPSYNSNAQTHYGLLITLEEERLCLQFCPDRNVGEIHPNAYAPASMRGVQKLGGGGSGVAVFGGHHEELGPVVMKHGSDKDLVELFALCTVAQELKHRSASHPDAARHISQRIPAFRMIYVSPHHLGEKRKALWNRLRNIRRINDTINPMLLPTDLSYDDDDDSQISIQHSPTSWRSYQDPPFQFGDDDCHTAEDEVVEAEESFRMLKNRSVLAQYQMGNAPQNLPPGVEMSKSGTFSGHRDIAIVTAAPGQQQRPQQLAQVKLRGESLVVVVPHMETDDNEEHSHTRKICVPGDGFQHLKSIVRDLLSLMGDNLWKFTLGQKQIGGENPQTGNEWLYHDNLLGPLLDNLVTQKINLVRDLVRLTTLEEQDPKVLESIREEVHQIELKQNGSNAKAESLSAKADAFVGNAIRKNFRSETGRIAMMMLLGKHFRDSNIKCDNKRPKQPSFLRNLSGNRKKNPKQLDSSRGLFLTPEEQIPAYHLGMITIPGALLGSTFATAPMEPTVLESMGPHSNYWQTLLSTAVAEKAPNQNSNSMVWKRLWTCGLADAGLHNLFLSENRLWLFDLGEPQLTSVPGFLTKFLFSFFHTLGMQEPATDSNTWVRRFEHNTKTCQLQLTSRTSQLLYLSYSAFEMALDRIVNELFNGDHSVRWLLLQYVTLQLISDASFCLQRWTIKGGGRARDSNHQEGLEKWLWRALWDIYVACDINSSSSLQRLNVQQRKLEDIPIVSPSLRERSISLIQELSLLSE